MKTKNIIIPALLILAFIVTPVSYATKMQTAQAQTSTSGVLIAMYIYPTNPAWNAVIAAHQNHTGSKVDIIANVNSGPGGSPANSDYTTGITNMRNAGINVLGYVFTSYCARPLSLVENDIAKWHSLYPGTNGILLDQMQNNPSATTCWAHFTPTNYYSTITSYIKGSTVMGSSAFVVGNPGTQTSSSFIGTVDTMIIYENSGMPSATTLQTNTFNGAFAKSNFAYDAFNVSPLDRTGESGSTSYVDWLYITDDNLPNPYDTIPGYLDAEIGIACGC